MEMEKNCRPCRIKAFFEREHTAAEKGVMVAAAMVAGIAVGLMLAPVTDGIHMEVSIGSHNGCNNEGCGSNNSSKSSKTNKKKRPK